MEPMEDAVIGGVSLKVGLGPLTSRGRGGRFYAEGEDALKLLNMLEAGRELDYEGSTDDGFYLRTGRVRIRSCRRHPGSPWSVTGDFRFISGPDVSRK